jgi:hypothetical protein
MSDETPKPPVPVPEERPPTSGTITNVRDQILDAREAGMQQHECPFCKSKNWHFHRDTFVVARPGAIQAVNVVPAHHDTYSTNRDTVYRADCLSCGFVALFRVNLGP